MLALNYDYPGYEDGRHKIITNCLGAALMARVGTCTRSAMIVLSNEKHNRLLEYQETACSKRDELLRTATSLIWTRLIQQSDLMLRIQIDLLIQESLNNEYTGQWVEVIPERLLYYKQNKSITEAGIFAVLLALNLRSIIDPEQSPNANTLAVEQKVEGLIKEWQKENMSEEDFLPWRKKLTT